jgi:hypothetical protein
MSPQLVEMTAQQSYPIEYLFPMDQYVDSASSFMVHSFADDPSMPFPDKIVSLPDSDYVLRNPIRVIVDYEENYYIVRDDRFLRYGTGGTLAEAKEDYGYALLEYYDDLIELEECLAPHLAYDLQELRNAIIPRKP